MTTTATTWKAFAQVNTTDAGNQTDIHLVGLPAANGGYVAVWTDASGTYNGGDAEIIGRRYDVLGNPTGGEIIIGRDGDFGSFSHVSPDITQLTSGTNRIAVAYVDNFSGTDHDIYVTRFDATGA